MLKPIVLAILLLITLGLALSLMPLLILFVPKHIDPSYPENMNCATCLDIWKHDAGLARKRGCYVDWSADLYQTRRAVKGGNPVRKMLLESAGWRKC